MRAYKRIDQLLPALAAAALLLLLLPMLLLGRCAVPGADDYTYGAAVYHTLRAGGTVWQALSAAVHVAADSWFDWQGTYAAIFLMSLQPAAFGDVLYALTPVLMLAALLLGIFSLGYALYGACFGMGKGRVCLVCTALCFLCTQLLPSAVQGFFWYNGSVYYTFFYGLLLLACALAIRLVQRGGALRQALLVLLAAALGGGNYVTALTAAILSVSALLLMPLLRTPGRKRLLIPTAVLLAGFLLSAAAPGNAVRQATVQPGPGALASVLLSFRAALRYMVRWSNLPLAGVLLALLPVLAPAAAASKASFRLPAVVSAFSYCLLSAMFCPSLYALGTPGDPRLINIIYFAFVFLAAGNLFYWLGWLLHREERIMNFMSVLNAGGGIICLILVLLMPISCALYLRAGGGMTSIGALGLLRSGEAQAYRACADGRLAVLEDPAVRDAALEPFPSQPYLLYFDDISEDPGEWINVAMSRYYDKDSVRIASRDPAGKENNLENSCCRR